LLGIEVLSLKSKCLLSKWLFKLITEELMWKELLHNKYHRNKTLAQLDAEPVDFPFWIGLIESKMTSSTGALLEWVMVKTLDFGRMFGLENLL
jgi:hypothetical protein